jgi:cbb3-type cytochrome oxidase subunit 3
VSPISGDIAGFIIVAMLIAFVGTWVWLWNSRHTAKFDAMARLPMSDAGDPP